MVIGAEIGVDSRFSQEATMARIPEEEIERLKARISLERLAEAKLRAV